MNREQLGMLKYWIYERNRILEKKENNDPKPWSDDPIFQNYRFCNVKREDDFVTRWFARNWRHARYWNEPNFVPAIILGRTINWPQTLDRIGFPHHFDPVHMIDVMDRIQASGSKVFTGAYMITAGPAGVRKNVWVVGNAETYFRHPPKLDPDSIQKSWEAIMEAKYPCVGPFIAGQIIADLKQTDHLSQAVDWWDWAAVGPGSMRGLNRLHDRQIKQNIPQEQALKEMLKVRQELDICFEICLQDIQNCLCEFDKYMRVKLGQGKPRAGYRGV